MTKFLKLMAVGAIALSGLFFSLPTWAANVDYFLKIEGIEGESVEPKHKDWINLLSVSQNITRPMGAGASSGRQLGPIMVTKEVDKASPKLLEAATKGKVFPKVEIHLSSSASEYGGSRSTYLKYELKNVMITSYQAGGSAGGDTVPMESFSLNYEEIKFVGPTAKEKAEENKPRRER